MTSDEAARHATIGMVVVREGTVTWLNDAARALAEPYGGRWSGPGSPVGPLTDLRPGSRRVAVRWPSPTGGTRWWEVTSIPLPDDASLLFEITDETDRYEADGRDTGPPTAQWRLARLESVAGMGSWVWNTRDNSMEWSEALQALIDVDPASRHDIDLYLGLVHPDDLAAVESTLSTSLQTLETFSVAHRMFFTDRSEHVVECIGEVFADAEGVPSRVMCTVRDVTEQHKVLQELAYLAENDPLTGIANRRRISGMLVDCAHDPHGGALLMIDIDNFKDINDLRGHAVGDRVIRRVARTIAARVGPDALLGRLGGDEFALVVPRCGPAEAVALAEHLCAVVAVAQMVAEAATLRITISVGVTTIVGGQDAEASLAQADLALYEAKDAGRNRARLFSPNHYHQAVRRVSLLHRVGTALDDDTMRLVAQPIVDLATGATTRHEVLIRLDDGLDPPLGPADFLPAAERTDLVLRLDRWVLERAVRALATPHARATGLHLEVNVSARSLEDVDLGSWILQRLKEDDVDPHRLGLEITETAAIESVDDAVGLATRLTGAGCGFTLDDFGAGFGSFSYLKHLPFTAVKIDGEFVSQLDTDAVDAALVTAVVGVARQLGMRTVAEQIDRPVLVDLLRELGVDDGQGFYLGRPRPLGELLERRD